MKLEFRVDTLSSKLIITKSEPENYRLGFDSKKHMNKKYAV